ncbi:MAG: DNA polymerase II large subunit, partial [Promethearchaeota archaeon]
DILFGYGEFVENNHTVIPSGYVEEWWAVELEAKIEEFTKNGKDPFKSLPADLSSKDVQAMIADPFANIPSAKQALQISITFQIGIHPHYLDHWGNIDGIDLLAIRKVYTEGLRQSFSLKDEKLNSHGSFSSLEKLSLPELKKAFEKGLEIPMNDQVKQAFIQAFVVHKQRSSALWLEPDRALVFFHLLGFGSTHNITKKIEEVATDLTALELFSHLTTITVPDKAPYYMGSRMGRPEKAKERKMKPPVHSLFPIGHDSKLQRSFQNAIGVPKINVEICQKICPSCKTVTFLNICPKCQTHTQFQKICPRCKTMFNLDENKCSSCRGYLTTTSQKSFSLKKYFETAAAKIPKSIPVVKGVKGMTSEYKVPEPIEKGILRAINGVFVYKDGTIRADATDIPLTHFTCKEINTPVEKILELGYDLDVNGDPITDELQVIEIKVQDVLLTHHLGDYFINVANFVDDELEYIYKQPRFYNIKDKYDLIGHYMVGLAPHTSAGIIGRLIGFTYAESGYAHPYWHSAKRRNCDGDEDGIMLLLECLLNFSLYYLPSSLGGKMDAPLVISLLLDPREVDAESHNVDYMSRYPLQFYLDSQTYCKPKLSYMKLFTDYLGTEAQFEGSNFTHPTKSINFGPRKSMYSVYETMVEKIDSQLYLAKTIQAVKVQDVARKVISSHFAPDILGNLRAFSTQSFRCPKCGSKYRRTPLTGRCTKCGNDIVMTVHPGGITKYLSKAQSFIKEFDLGAYTEQRWKIIARNVKDVTDNPRVKQKSIVSFFK